MKLYNTLSKQKEEFVPLEEGKVRMYVCGPTVYNFIHIGNARPMIVFDTVRRYFEYKGYDVNYVSNFTDVDDKIIKKAIEEGVTADEISKRYIAECKKDMEGMNIKPATKHPLATEEICGMVDMIQTLIDKGYAYEKNGTVYYRTRKFQDYGKLSHKNLDDLRSGERSLLVTGEDEKEDPLDFVLWKPKKEGEPFWESPWSEGRPGWHIECSEMSKKYLGEQIDIHAGGEDLVFPHHENEIAQSEAANGKEFAKYWMHNAFLNIDNKKMSKSLGNFRTVREISEQYDLQVLRFFMLSAHYRSPLNFSADLMEASKNGLERIVNAAENLKYKRKNAKTEAMTEEEKRATAYHEAGHAMVHWLLPNADPVLKVTIIPRGNSLGATWFLPDERHTRSKAEMLDEMATLVAGRVGEKMFTGELSTGAASDLDRLTSMAYNMIMVYGMGDSVPNMSYYGLLSNGNSLTKPFSDKTADEIDKEVRSIVDSSIDRATEIIQGNKDKFVRLAELLYEKEVIFAEDIESVLGPKVKPDTGADQTVPDASGDGSETGQEGGEPEAGETVTEK